MELLTQKSVLSWIINGQIWPKFEENRQFFNKYIDFFKIRIKKRETLSV